MNNMKALLDDYLKKDTRVTQKDAGNGYQEVCDLDTGDCYTIRMKDGLTPSTGLQIVNSGSSTSAQAQLSIVTVGDKFAAFNIGTSGSGTQNNYWHLSKRNAAASHSLNLYNNNQGSFSSPLFSFISAGTSTLGENLQIQIDGANNRVGIQTTPSEWIHLSSEPASNQYLQIDAALNSTVPAPATGNASKGYGIIANDYYLAEPDYWMEIKLKNLISGILK